MKFSLRQNFMFAVNFLINFFLMNLLAYYFYNFWSFEIILWIFMAIVSAIIFPFKVVESGGNVKIRMSLRVLPIDVKCIYVSKYLISIFLVFIYTILSFIFVLFRVKIVLGANNNQIFIFCLFLFFLTTCIFVIRINLNDIQSAITSIFFICLIFLLCFLIYFYYFYNTKHFYTFFKSIEIPQIWFYVYSILLLGINIFGFKIYRETMSYRRLQ